MKNILELLERAARVDEGKTAYADEENALTYGELMDKAKAVGSALLRVGRNKPIAVMVKRGAANLKAFLGVVYSGNFYVVIDEQMPTERIHTIIDTLNPAAFVVDGACLEKARGMEMNLDIFVLEEMEEGEENEEGLKKVRREMIDTDPLYALFTSGSTGVPKGAVISHRNVLAYSEWVCETFGITKDTVFGNQTPFYFSMSVLDVFATLRAGATLHVIPKSYFSFPLRLLTFLKEREVNTIYWVPSALGMVANWKALDAFDLPKLKKVLFAGEVMPVRQLNYWREKIPDAIYANLYGPTEATDICTYYIVDREFSPGESLPIGHACNNCAVMVLDEEGRPAKEGQEGELCIRGSFLAMGYYNNPDKTKEAFVQNPLNPHYPEWIYKTGDLVRYNERGELVFVTRKDFQMKKMGYRIEPGEIEAAAGAVPGLRACACIYVPKEKKICLFYQGKEKPEEVGAILTKRLPSYMMPDECIKMDQMPLNANGKIDRKELKRQRDY